uniref:Olfactory receptor n=1 Tax=Geotrypetes seraphini TaxID=260995 RepID=A0A6P8Q1I5_GEOSA|nr:olfactory receptor 11H12-like [Geotrypetes seraphini]XP_033781118.1 olfactory receptor 11H12-like [Geotrypetes seraphini]XP_033781119.1 olfactory receptor 11H12-like [Geotrypetes seraphini]
MLTIIGNIVTIILVWSDPRLHKPMYIFLCNLSFIEIWYTTSTVPNMLFGMLTKNKVISFTGCFLQFYFFFSLGTAECFILAVMGYDRYLAICHPLHYNILMSSRICSNLAIICWICAFLWTAVPVILIEQLPFCGPNEINHFLCDPGPLLELSCLKNYGIEMMYSICNSLILLTTFSFSFISYGFIIKTILRIPSSSGRHKAFSTCASHLMVVIMFFGCATSMNMKPSGNHPVDADKVVIVFYTVVTPLLNPIIYTLRNKEIWNAVKKIVSSH